MKLVLFNCSSWYGSNGTERDPCAESGVNAGAPKGGR